MKNSRNRGTLQLTNSQFIDYFSHLVIGYYKKGYEPTSYRVKSEKR